MIFTFERGAEQIKGNASAGPRALWHVGPQRGLFQIFPDYRVFSTNPAKSRYQPLHIASCVEIPSFFARGLVSQGREKPNGRSQAVMLMARPIPCADLKSKRAAGRFGAAA